MKRFFMFLCTVCMIGTASGLVCERRVQAAESDYTYTSLENGTVKINKYNGSATDVTIPF